MPHRSASVRDEGAPMRALAPPGAASTQDHARRNQELATLPDPADVIRTFVQVIGLMQMPRRRARRSQTGSA